MTGSQLKHLIGCILVYKLSEITILSIEENAIFFIDEDGNYKSLGINYFIIEYIPKLKIYLTEEENSLVSIKHYLKHFDLN